MDADRLLGIYLNDHLAGATAGLALVRRAHGSNRGSDLGDVLEHLTVEIDRDREELLRVMRLLEVRPSRTKRAGALVAERLGRLKLNGRLTGYSPLSRVLELEGLTLGIQGKRLLWINLRESASVARRLEGVDLADMAERAERQLARLEPHRAEAVRTAFEARA